ncbi:MAG TPA: glycosyltransferase family 4 protein [Polyangiaceae bacterium]|jgi:glycosyltransferase involved in cell wall biosynthesis|nr:glycosyltransferase family 4 protein [Polyangiaceae bacterium]
MRVLILTKIFPNRAEPRSSPFNRQQFAALSRLCDVDVLATIPWFPGASHFAKWSRAGRLLDVPENDVIDGVKVHHPRFVFLPKVGHAIAGPLYVASLASTAMKYAGRVDVVLGSWAYPDGFAAVALARLLGVPSVIKLHGSDMNVVAELRGPRRLVGWALSHADRVVAVSNPLRDRAVALGAVPSRVDVVRNGVDRSRFHPRDRAEARRELGVGDGPMALYVGNVERHKGAVDLVNAFSPSGVGAAAHLYVVGDGAAMTECKELVARSGARITFVGSRPHDQIPLWMAAADVLVLPSWNEGTPNVVLEALACGRRVVATAVGGTPDVVTSPVAGVLVPPRSPDVLGRALGEALAEPYDPASVVAALPTPDWSESAAMLFASLTMAVEGVRRKAA